MGDQFVALSETEDAGSSIDDHRHVGIVVDDREAVGRALDREEIDRLDVQGLEFRDPWGNRIQIVEYAAIQFTKADHVLRGMGLDHLEKSASAVEELAQKGLAQNEDDGATE